MTPENLMQALEEATALTAWLTGVKADLVQRGWNERNAERVVIELIHTMPGGGK